MACTPVDQQQIRLVDLYNGDVVNFAGDALFVLFHADDIATAAQRAAACALAMLDGVAQRLKVTAGDAGGSLLRSCGITGDGGDGDG